MQLFGDDQSAHAVEAHGNRWFDRQGHGWNRTTRSIKPVDGQLVYTLLQESFKYDYKGMWERTIECQFSLEKENQ